MELRPPEPLRLAGRDSLDKRAIDQMYLVQAGVVLLDQVGRDDLYQARVTLEAGALQVA